MNKFQWTKSVADIVHYGKPATTPDTVQAIEGATKRVQTHQRADCVGRWGGSLSVVT